MQSDLVPFRNISAYKIHLHKVPVIEGMLDEEFGSAKPKKVDARQRFLQEQWRITLWAQNIQ